VDVKGEGDHMRHLRELANKESAGEQELQPCEV
jgi:hypothetical protein